MARTTKPSLGDVKPELSPGYLRDHRIHYYEGVFHDSNYKGSDEATKSIGSIPKRVNDLRCQLLHFDSMIPKGSDLGYKVAELFPDTRRFRSDEGIPAAAYWETPPCPTQGEQDHIAAQVKQIKSCNDKTGNFQAEDEAEIDWTFQYQKIIFQNYRDVQSDMYPDKSGLAHKREGPLTEQWRMAFDKLWGEVDEGRRDRRFRKPKPDITYGFPIFTGSELAAKRSSLGALDNAAIRTFSLGTHRWLRKNEAFTSPFTGMTRRDGVAEGPSHSRPRMSSRLCFPWAIVEFKKDGASGSEVRKCYQQAANAAAAALRLQRTVASMIPRQPKDDDMFPLITFTCVGSRVKTWLAYSSYKTESREEEARHTEMVCIWDVDLKRPWGLYSLSILITNMRNKWVFADAQLRAGLVKRLDLLEVPHSAPRESIMTPIRTSFPRMFTPEKQCNEDTRHDVPASVANSPSTETGPRPCTSTALEGRLASLKLVEEGGPGSPNDSGVGGMALCLQEPPFRRRASVDTLLLTPELERILGHEKKDPKPGRHNRMTEFWVKFKGEDKECWVSQRRPTMYYAEDLRKYQDRCAAKRSQRPVRRYS